MLKFMIAVSVLRKLGAMFHRDDFHKIAAFVGLLIIAGACSHVGFEGGTWPDGFWWAIVTMTTVGYGDIYPATMFGRAFAVVLMVVGSGIFCMMAAWFASVLMEMRMKADKGLGDHHYMSGHVVIVGWNSHAQTILDEIHGDKRFMGKYSVIVADCENKPTEDERVRFIRGEATEETFTRAGVQGASTVIILGDETLQPLARDAIVLLSSHLVEDMNRGAHTIAVLSDKRNEAHAKRMHVDEVIVGEEITSRLIASAARDPGLSDVIANILNPGIDVDVETILIDRAVTPDLIDASWKEVVFKFAGKAKTPIAVKMGKGGICTNPFGVRMQHGYEIIAIVNRS